MYEQKIIISNCAHLLCINLHAYILLTKTTAARKGVALSYHSVRGLYFLAVVFVRSIIHIAQCTCNIKPVYCVVL